MTARRPRRRFTSQYKLEVLRTADACTQPGQLGALLRQERLYSSHLVTWRKQRVAGLTPKKRGRKLTADPRIKQLEREKASLETDTRRLERRLQRADTVIAFHKQCRSSYCNVLHCASEYGVSFDVGPAVGLDHAEVREEQRHGLAPHRRAAVRMARQLPGFDPLLRARVLHQSLPQDRPLARRDHPPDDVATEHIEHHRQQ